jgi:hypothetical protein
MAEPRLQATFLQISDLHLDPRGSASGSGNAPLPLLYHLNRRFDGLLGRKLEPNALIVHRILNDGDSYIWRASAYERSRLGFAPTKEREIDL